MKWSNGEMKTNRIKPKKLGEKPAPVPLCPPGNSDEVT
jgi:hypothetical protein